VSILHGDCLAVMPTLDADSVDAIVSDPPYGLAFMGKAWDYGVPGPEFWREALRVAKPGAYLVAFGGTRTYHRLTCAIEDAGWEIRDCLSWLYGSGFPKSHNGPWGGTALKPAWEPIILARKPLVGTVAANVAQYGTGGLNIDATRIGFASKADKAESTGKNQHTRYANPGSNRDSYSGNMPPRTDYDASGRWPANVCLDEDAAGMLDEQTGNLGVSSGGGMKRDGRNNAVYGTHTGHEQVRNVGHGDSGGASRFFYCAKSSRKEREAGLEGMDGREQGQRYGNVQDARPHTSEGYEYSRKPTSNHHPTVKPIALMRWLCRLVTPKGGLILDPFTGSGTTGCAAVLEGFRFVGIEREAEYVEIAEKRIAHWASAEPDLFAVAL
jgi:site-specific DNA-methyltransferase (adenine-specific)